MGSGVLISCIDVAALLVEFLQRAATSSRCKRGGVPCEPPPERASKKIIASTAALAWMKSTSFLQAAEWMSTLGLQERTDPYNLLVLTARSPTLQHPGSAIQPAGPPRPPPVDGPPFGRGEASRGEAVQAPPPSPHRRRPDCGIGGRRSHAHASRGQPGATPSAQPPRPLHKGPPGSAVSAPPRPPTVAAGRTGPGSARGLLSSSDAALNFESEIQGHSSS